MEGATVAQGEVVVEIVKGSILYSEGVHRRMHAKDGLPRVDVCRISRDHRWPREGIEYAIDYWRRWLATLQTLFQFCAYPKALLAMIGSAYSL